MVSVPAASTASRDDDGPSACFRLVTVTHFFPAHGGGLEKVAEKLVMGLVERGFRISWFSSDTDHAPEHAGSQAISVSTTNFVERWTQLPYPLWTLRAVPRLWREIGRAHAVHVHEHLYYPSLLAVLMARLRQRPVVITQHMGALSLGNRALTLTYEAGARTLGWVLFRLATRSVFISRNVLEFFGRAHLPSSELIFNGVETGRFTPVPPEERTAIRERLGLPIDRKVVLFVGRFVRKKGLNRVLALAERFPDAVWVLVGSGPEAPGAEAPNVRVAGRVEHDRLADYYRAADLLILPSAGEGMPLVVQEALCCGAGVLSTDEVASACPEAADMIRTQPVPRRHDNLDGWEAALRAIFQDPAYLDARIERSRRAHALWSWDRCVSRYVELFHELVEVPCR